LAVGSHRVEAIESFFEQIGHWPWGGPFVLRLTHSAKPVESAVIGSAALALVGAVVAEFLDADYGIGYLIRQGQFSHHTEVMLAAIVVIAVLGACYFALIQRIVRFVLLGSGRRPSDTGHSAWNVHEVS
jgi:ABC-type nitrate/sulfonate/bicarbonate transport system permease component